MAANSCDWLQIFAIFLALSIIAVYSAQQLAGLNEVLDMDLVVNKESNLHQSVGNVQGPEEDFKYNHTQPFSRLSSTHGLHPYMTIHKSSSAVALVAQTCPSDTGPAGSWCQPQA